MGLRDIFSLFVLFFIGLFYHIYGYVLNDYADIELDKKSVDLTKKPLVSGLIPKNHALFIIVSAAISTYILTVIFFPYLISIFLLSCAMILAAIYDMYGKKIPGFSDFIIAGSLAFSFFFGASVVSLSFTSITLLVGLLTFVSIVFVNVVEGGLKDVDHDFLSGGKTLATMLGVKVNEGRLIITKKFIGAAYGLIGMICVVLLFLFMQPLVTLFDGLYIRLSLILFLLVIVFIVCYRLLHLPVFDRSKIKRLYSIINGLAGAGLFIIIYPLLGVEVLVILLALPVTWYVLFNMALYGKPLQPDI
jgi:4-hydroxybenzoate polyprenyltransferase